jgi:DNA-binding FadR family transcriptional regulator
MILFYDPTKDIPLREAGIVARPVRRVTVRAQIVEELQRLVLTGEVGVGEPLPSEAELCRLFQCSRGAVREALRSLEEAGLVARAANGRELIVQPVTLDKVSNAVQLYMHQSEVTFDELFEFFEGVEPWMTRRAAMRRSPELLERLQAVHEQRPTDTESFIATEEAFHALLEAMCGNRLLAAARKPLHDALHIAMTEIAPRMGRTMIDETVEAHGRILDAVAAGDGEAAAQAAVRHTAAYRRWLEAIGKAAQDPVRPLQLLVRR